MTTTAKPCKLRSGDWGATVSGTHVREGDTITIITKAGKSWQARVSKVVWSGSGVSICATESLTARGQHRDQGYQDYCGYACPVGGFICSPRNGPCHDCQ